MTRLLNIHKTQNLKDKKGFPGSLVVRILWFHCWGHMFHPWLGNWDSVGCAAQKKKKKIHKILPVTQVSLPEVVSGTSVLWILPEGFHVYASKYIHISSLAIFFNTQTAVYFITLFSVLLSFSLSYFLVIILSADKHLLVLILYFFPAVAMWLLGS